MHDLRDALRQLTHKPGLSLAIILTLGLGTGANALVFSVVHGVLLEPLPFSRPEQLVAVWQTQSGNDTRGVAPGNFLDWRGASSFDGLAAYDWRRRSLGGDDPERLPVAAVSANFFAILGVDVLVGRTFGEPVGSGGPREVILREDLWRRRFAADPTVVGRSLVLDDERVVVAGVIPTSKGFPEDVSAWTQARHDVPELTVGAPPGFPAVRDVRYLRVLGRLKDGVTRRQAQAEMDALAARLRDAYPDANADTGVNIVALKDQLTGASAQTIWILFGVVGCVLAVACANIATLLIAAAAGRMRELQIRAALGASRLRLVRQLSTEGLLLAGLGTSLGLALAWLGHPALIALLPAGTPRLASTRVDGTVAGFTCLVSVLATTFFGAAPAVMAARKAAVSHHLRDGGRSGPSKRTVRMSSILMAAQLALALVLVTGTGLMLRTLWSLFERDPGIDVERLLTLDATIPDARSRGRAAAADDIRRMVERVAALPGVSAAGAIQVLPLASRGPSGNIRVEGRSYRPNEAPDVAWRTVTPGYFQAAGISIRRGRAFTDEDRAGAPPVAIINETLARMVWPGSDPLGNKVGTGLDGDGAPVIVVGVVEDVPQEGIAAKVLPEMYRPLAQPSRFRADAMWLVVRTDGEPARLAIPVREAIREVHPQAPVSAVRPMSMIRSAGVAREIVAARALGSFGALALLLAGVGLHGVMARLVTDRKRELGVRVALGADPRRLQTLVLGRTLRVAAAGVVAGACASAVLSRQLGALLHGANAGDPLVFAGASAALLVVALLASYGPARSAARVDPLIVLKSE